MLDISTRSGDTFLEVLGTISKFENIFYPSEVEEPISNLNFHGFPKPREYHLSTWPDEKK